MACLVPGIHVLASSKQEGCGWPDEPGRDGKPIMPCMGGLAGISRYLERPQSRRASHRAAREGIYAGDLKGRQPLPPPGPKAEPEREWGRRVIGIRPIIGWSRVIIRDVIVAIVVPIVATRTQVCRFRRVEWLYASFRRSRGGRTNRRRSGQRQNSRDDRSSNQCLHGTLLMIAQRPDNAPLGARGFIRHHAAQETSPHRGPVSLTRRENGAPVGTGGRRRADWRRAPALAPGSASASLYPTRH